MKTCIKTLVVLLGTSLGVVGLVGCGSLEAKLVVGDVSLHQYEEVARFLPTGNQSYLLQAPFSPKWGDKAALESFPWPEWGEGDQPILAVAGSGFEFPVPTGDSANFDISHIVGKVNGVMVLDFGEHGLSQPRECIQDMLRGSNPADARGVIRLSSNAAPSRVGYWPVVCALEDRFVVGASSEEELEIALARTSTLEGLVSAFPPLAFVSQDSDYVVCRKAVPETNGPVILFEPAQDLVISVRLCGGDWVMYHRDPLPDRPWCTVHRRFTQSPTLSRELVNGWTVSTLRGGWRGLPDEPGWGKVGNYGESWIERFVLFGLTVKM